MLFTRSTLPVPAEEIKPKAWALSDEKATRFDEKKKKMMITTLKKSFSQVRGRPQSPSSYCSTNCEARKR